MTLKPNASAPNTNNSFTLTVDGEAAAGETIFFSLFSLFPPTYKNRANGIRPDIAEASTSHCDVITQEISRNNLGFGGSETGFLPFPWRQ